MDSGGAPSLAEQLAAKRFKMKKPEQPPPSIAGSNELSDALNISDKKDQSSDKTLPQPLETRATKPNGNDAQANNNDDNSLPTPPPPNPFVKLKPMVKPSPNGNNPTLPPPPTVGSNPGNIEPPANPFVKLRAPKSQPPPPPPANNVQSKDSNSTGESPKPNVTTLTLALNKTPAESEKAKDSSSAIPRNVSTDMQAVSNVSKKPSLTIEVPKTKLAAPIPESPSAPPPPTRKPVSSIISGENAPSPLTGNDSPTSDATSIGSVPSPIFQFKKAPLPPVASLAPPPAAIKTNNIVRKNSVLNTEIRIDSGPSSPVTPIVKNATGEGPVSAGDASSFWKSKASGQVGVPLKKKNAVNGSDSQPESPSSPAAPNLPPWKRQLNTADSNMVESSSQPSFNLKKAINPTIPNLPNNSNSPVKTPAPSWKKDTDAYSSNSSLLGTKSSVPGTSWKNKSTDDNSKTTPQEETLKPFSFALKNKQKTDSVYDLDIASKSNSRDASPTSSNKQLTADDGSRIKKGDIKNTNDIELKNIGRKITEMNLSSKSLKHPETERHASMKNSHETPVANKRTSSYELSSLAKSPTNNNQGLTKSQSFKVNDSQTRDSSVSLDVDDIFSLDMFQQKSAPTPTPKSDLKQIKDTKLPGSQPSIKTLATKSNLSAISTTKPQSPTKVSAKKEEKVPAKQSRSIFKKAAPKSPTTKKPEKTITSPTKTKPTLKTPASPKEPKLSAAVVNKKLTESTQSLPKIEKKPLESIKIPIPEIGSKILSSAPFKLKIYRETIPNDASSLDPKDLDLVATQIYQDLSKRHPGLSACDFAKITQLIERGDKLAAIEETLKVPGYFGLRVSATANISNVDIAVDINLGKTSLNIFKDMYDLVDQYHYDDLKHSRVSESIVNLDALGNSKDFRLKDITSDLFLDILSSHINELRDNSKFAVAVANYKANDGSRLSFEKGAIINVLERDRDQGWIHGQYNGVSGWFLDEYVSFLVDAPREKKIALTGESAVKSNAFQETTLQNEADNKLIKSVMESAAQQMTQVPVSAQETLSRDPSSPKHAPKSPLAQQPLDFNEPPSPVTKDEKEGWGDSKTDIRRTSTVVTHQGPLPTFIDWATRNFAAEQSFVGTLKRLAGKAKNELEDHWKEIVNRIKWTNVPITTPLTQQVREPFLVKVAVEIFENILMYTGDLHSTKTHHDIITFILSNAINKQRKLEDEIFAQVVKQTTNNKSRFRESEKRAWDLLYILCLFAYPTESLEMHLYGHLTYSVNQKRDYWQMAEKCIFALKKSKVCPRKSLPSLDEVTNIELNLKYTLQVSFPEGSQRSFEIDSHTQSKEIVKQCCSQFHVRATECYGLTITFEPGNFAVIPVNSSDYLFDALNDGVKSFSENQLGRFDHINVVFTRKLWLEDDKEISSTLAPLVFHQLAEGFKSGEFFSYHELDRSFRDNVAKISSMLMLAYEIGPNDSDKVKDLIPPVCKETSSPSDWPGPIGRFYSELHTQPLVQVMKLGITELKSWKNGRSWIFRCDQCSDNRFYGGCIIAVSHNCVRVLDRNSRKIEEEFAFSNIMNYFFENGEFIIRGYSSLVPENKLTMRFKTPQALVIFDLLNNYIRVIQSLKKKKTGTTSKSKINRMVS